MKFDRVIPKKNWPVWKTYQRLSLTMKDIASYNQQMNAIDGEVNNLKHKKEAIRKKVANKWRYSRQLKEQINEQKLVT